MNLALRPQVPPVRQAVKMRSHSHISSPCWYLIVAYAAFGVLHELFHLGATWILFDTQLDDHDEQTDFQWHIFLMEALLGRFCRLGALPEANTWQFDAVKHAGWILSALVAVLVYFYTGPSQRKHKASLTSDTTDHYYLLMAAVVTSIEAIATDLLGIGTLCGTTVPTFFCGNFGILLLNPVWQKKIATTALELLEKMIEVTMVRGAQSGGVLVWNSSHDKTNSNQAILTRVVAGKRTDLSKDLRKRVQQLLPSVDSNIAPIQAFMGHTRFATSSKATLEGTHPHRWTPASNRRVFSVDDFRGTSSTLNIRLPKLVVRKVVNYITHNGDFDFFRIHGELFQVKLLQEWVEEVTGVPMPADVDSCAIAGMMDILRTAGCFGLSLRFAMTVGCQRGIIGEWPSYEDYEELGKIFEEVLLTFCQNRVIGLYEIGKTIGVRKALVNTIYAKLMLGSERAPMSLRFLWTDEESAVQANLLQVTMITVDAFFDNNLFKATQFFMQHAVGSFGLVVSCSEDAHRQICIAARGQPMSVAFYPELGLVCYGSELAAVKAGLGVSLGPKAQSKLFSCSTEFFERKIANQTCRFDLDDLGGEVVLLDWGGPRKATDPMVSMESYHESIVKDIKVQDRIIPLQDNDLLLPLPEDSEDPVFDDLKDIPHVLQSIQSQWREGGLNRVTAWNLSRHLRDRLEIRANGTIPVNGNTVDILVTGCEVSLWLAEQFASDLQKAFPRLCIKAVSSNKVLGVFGQDLSVPAIGHSLSGATPDLHGAIVIIVSHSGGTFGPLAISNLLQSVTRSIFLVSSEWDTQIGKVLRGLAGTDADMLSSRVFSTNIGFRPAEPSSLSVAATHQLLTQIFEHIAALILNDQRFRKLSGAMITERDLSVLERCNQDSILALENIVGRDDGSKMTETERELRKAGQLWADHVLENARAYLITFLYVVGTVTSGYPLVSGIASTAGLNNDSIFYLTRFLDSLIYFFLPQINVILIRLWQGRNIRHRMVGRTVVIGDVPWVSQAADAFLSKLFARSYSIAGLNVLSGNPADHLMHRHTHRIVRGTLLICGRPDGRLSALTTAECATNLCVSQASSIQSIGGTCESITLGHNPSKLPLTKTDIFLGTFRPKFLCERIVGIVDKDLSRKQTAQQSRQHLQGRRSSRSIIRDTRTRCWMTGTLKRSIRRMPWFGSSKRSLVVDSANNDEIPNRSSYSLKGLYLNLQGGASKTAIAADLINAGEVSPERKVLESMIHERKRCGKLEMIFRSLDSDGSGSIDLDEFIGAYQTVETSMLTQGMLTGLFKEADVDGDGVLDFAEFMYLLGMPKSEVIRKIYHGSTNRDSRGLLQVDPSDEIFFGQELYSKTQSALCDFAQSQSQHYSMELYESRVASLQRFVSLCVIFHEMGKSVQEFFPKVSFGYLGYRMDRTHSIMRIATTATPISGDAVRERMETMRWEALITKSVRIIIGAWFRYQKRHYQSLRKLESDHLLVNKDSRAPV